MVEAGCSHELKMSSFDSSPRRLVQDDRMWVGCVRSQVLESAPWVSEVNAFIAWVEAPRRDNYEFASMKRNGNVGRAQEQDVRE